LIYGIEMKIFLSSLLYSLLCHLKSYTIEHFSPSCRGTDVDVAVFPFPPSAGHGSRLCEGGIGGMPARTAGHRSSSFIFPRTESTCCPQPAHEILPQEQVVFRHIFTIERLILSRTKEKRIEE
jgi:hypothetical protein